MSETSRLLIPAVRADADGRFDGARPAMADALALGVGGFVLHGGEQEAVRLLTRELQQKSRVPLLVGAEMERGAGQQFGGATGLPPLAAIAWLDDLEALKRAARLTAREARTMGVNWTFGPVCDLDLEPRNPTLGTRALGDDPARVGRLAVAWIEACQAEGVVACAKHFPGLGRATEDPHRALPVIAADRDTLHATDLEPFRAVIAANVASMMTAHAAYPALDPGGLPATLSRELLTWLLRQQLRYDGLLVSDSLAAGGVAASAPDEGEAAVRAIAAGCDVILAPADLARTAKALEEALATRRLDPTRVQQAVRRRLKWAQWAAPPNDWRRPIAADAAWGAQLADRVVHVARGAVASLGGAVEVVVVDDDAADAAAPEAEGGDRVRLRWDAAAQPMVVVRDPASGAVLSFARGGDASIAASGAEVELVYSDGVKSVGRRERGRGR
ncbi:glycoside hydrolase family 3 N-terminal domain-containing protein [Roseisolibacter sp. H3M3-2]|uniref:glycoside hydrolase family 3 protein n=1 Tax=Roseisolibacter sp. H3M3-2 TaxID=3031323 RepID=UPI0023DBF732|nr:glycoside hydrolase family 3 N-terminal domain-containing protein [Roseisolibacter sp. H3M3-2]MDF1505611.1 glycoside hydrolase family 3 N-terminal domain-containing protein [Roseisolibacter sp. H3M3-2]